MSAIKRAGTCKYFTGFQNECCDLNINYLELSGQKMRAAGFANRLPCLRWYSGPEPIKCTKREVEHEDGQIPNKATNHRMG